MFEMVGSRVRRIREYMATPSGNAMVFGDEQSTRIV
jgi:hypothetical protein